MILQDKYALHRSPFSGEPVGDPDWTKWDYVLSSVLQIIEDYTMSNGLLAWEHDSDKVEVYAVQKMDKYEAARAKREKGDKNPKPGVYYVPSVRLKPFSKEWPTFKEWATNPDN